ncbi:Threonine--tRNA ligase 1 [compost metagenome]
MLPERFELEYVGDDGAKHRPVVLHRGILGTMERFAAFLLENFAGNLPLWLAPVQAKVIPVSGAFEEYARSVEDKLRAGGIRAESDLRNEKLGYKIREAQLEKIPYMFVVGESEQSSGSVSVRKRGEGDLGAKALDEVLELLQGDIKNHTI